MGEAGLPGAKKGAHYSAPPPFGTSRAAVGLLAALGLVWTGSAPRAAPRPEADTQKTEARLEAVKAEIERITREVSAEQVERDRLTGALRSAELSLSDVRGALLEVRRERTEGAARRSALAAEKHERESQLADNRAALAGQMRAAYLIGRQEPLKLLLNQQDPALAGRMFAYYSYFGRALLLFQLREFLVLGLELHLQFGDALHVVLDELDLPGTRAPRRAGAGARQALARAGES